MDFALFEEIFDRNKLLPLIVSWIKIDTEYIEHTLYNTTLLIQRTLVITIYFNLVNGLVNYMN